MATYLRFRDETFVIAADDMAELVPFLRYLHSIGLICEVSETPQDRPALRIQLPRVENARELLEVIVALIGLHSYEEYSELHQHLRDYVDTQISTFKH